MTALCWLGAALLIVAALAFNAAPGLLVLGLAVYGAGVRGTLGSR